MRTCHKCGQELTDRSKFCPGCGEAVPKLESETELCPVCGAERRAGSKFCKHCGTSFAFDSEVLSAQTENHGAEETSELPQMPTDAAETQTVVQATASENTAVAEPAVPPTEKSPKPKREK